MNTKYPPSLSIVIPCHNEEEVIESTCSRLEIIIGNWPTGSISNIEFILVNNGSTDNTLAAMLAYQKKNDKVVIVDLGKNYGYQGSITAGLQYAQHDVVVTIDADLQDDPEKIWDMLVKYREGYELVLGVRSNRYADSFLKRITAQLFYIMLKKMGIKSVSNHGDFRLMSRRLVQEFNKLPERNRYIRSLIFELESQYACVYYKRTKRQKGKSKFSLLHLIILALDGITSFTSLPIRIVTLAGILMFLFSIAMAIYVLYIKFIIHVNVPGWSFLAILFLFFGGINCLSTGIIGEYIGRIYTEVKQRPIYTVRKLYRSNKEAHMSTGKLLDQYVQEKVKELLDKDKFPNYDDIYTDTLAETIDKLIIVHIRYWYLEDAMANAKSDTELAALRRKSEILFKEKRPMLVAALDKLLVNMLTGKTKYTPSNLKKYEGWNKK